MTTREQRRLDRTVRPIWLFVIDGMAKCPGCKQQVRAFPAKEIGIRLPFDAHGWIVHHLDGERQCSHSSQNIYFKQPIMTNDKQLTQEEKDALSRATRDAFEARVRQPAPVGFVEDPRDHFDATELQDSDSYKEFERKQNQKP